MSTPYVDLQNIKDILNKYGSGIGYSELTITTDNLKGKQISVVYAGVETIHYTFSDAGSVVCKLKKIGTYEIFCEGLSYGTAQMDKLGTRKSMNINKNQATINITTTESSLFNRVVTVKKGSVTVGSDVFGYDGKASVNVSETGTYTIQCTNASGETAEKTVEVTDVTFGVTFTATLVLVKLVSWSAGTDAEISAMLEAYYAGSLSIDDIKSVWAVGDSRTVHLSAMSATGVSDSHGAQDVEFIIIGFEHDDLDTPVGSRIKACVTIHMKDCLNNGYMNISYTSYTNAQYSTSKRRTWMNDVFEKSLPSYLQGLIKPVTKLTHEAASSSNGVLASSTERCFLLSNWEVFGTTYGNAVKKQDGNQYEYYTTVANRVKKTNDGTDRWWIRTGFYDYGESVACFVGCLSGTQYHYVVINRIGLAVGMAL